MTPFEQSAIEMGKRWANELCENEEWHMPDDWGDALRIAMRACRESVKGRRESLSEAEERERREAEYQERRYMEQWEDEKDAEEAQLGLDDEEEAGGSV